MTTTPTHACPSWCAFDHVKSEHVHRANHALMVAACDIPDTPEQWATLEEDLAGMRTDHSRRVGKHVDIVSDSENPSPRIMVFVDYADEMRSAGQARALAADLIVAADQLDEILGAS